MSPFRPINAYNEFVILNNITNADKKSFGILGSPAVSILNEWHQYIDTGRCLSLFLRCNRLDSFHVRYLIRRFYRLVRTLDMVDVSNRTCNFTMCFSGHSLKSIVEDMAGIPHAIDTVINLCGDISNDDGFLCRNTTYRFFMRKEEFAFIINGCPVYFGG